MTSGGPPDPVMETRYSPVWIQAERVSNADKVARRTGGEPESHMRVDLLPLADAMRGAGVQELASSMSGGEIARVLEEHRPGPGHLLLHVHGRFPGRIPPPVLCDPEA